MLEVMVGIQSAVILGLVALSVFERRQLWRIAMSRTPGEFRASEKPIAKTRVARTPDYIDEDVQAVLASVSEEEYSSEDFRPMPIGLDGS